MLASITPLGERARNQTWAITVAFYLVGSMAGGAALGVIAGVSSTFLSRAVRPSGAATLFTVGAAAVAALLIDGPWSHSVPSIRRQVNEDWLRRYRSWVYGMGFGLQLGTGVATVVTSASTYLVFMVALVSPRFELSVAIGTTYGLVRALPILLTARVTTFARLGQLHQRLSSLQANARRLTMAAELTVALVAAGRAVAAR